jgi:hypothetical protein
MATEIGCVSEKTQEVAHRLQCTLTLPYYNTSPFERRLCIADYLLGHALDDTREGLLIPSVSVFNTMAFHSILKARYWQFGQPISQVYRNHIASIVHETPWSIITTGGLEIYNRCIRSLIGNKQPQPSENTWLDLLAELWTL